MSEIKSRFNSTYESLRAFVSYRLHYQVHINTNLELVPKIDYNLLNL